MLDGQGRLGLLQQYVELLDLESALLGLKHTATRGKERKLRADVPRLKDDVVGKESVRIPDVGVFADKLLGEGVARVDLGHKAYEVVFVEQGLAKAAGRQDAVVDVLLGGEARLKQPLTP